MQFFFTLQVKQSTAIYSKKLLWKTCVFDVNYITYIIYAGFLSKEMIVTINLRLMVHTSYYDVIRH